MRLSLRRAVMAGSLFFLLLFTTAQRAWAWGSPGHMAVAYVAWHQLTPEKQARVTALLKLNTKYYPIWLGYIPSGTSQADTDMYVFMMAATWPDEIRGDSTYTGTDTILSDMHQATLNIGYTDLDRHLYWHFVDVPLSTGGPAPTTAPVPNAETQISAFRDVLASADATDDLKSYDLIWIEHLVGDIHQPLHCTDRYIAGKDDRGGNEVTLSSGKNLHSFWDDLPGSGTTQNYSVAVKFATSKTAPLPAPSTADVSDTNLDDWVQASSSLAKSDAYKSPPVSPTGKKSTLTPAYKKMALADARSQIALAGARLAKIINDSLV